MSELENLVGEEELEPQEQEVDPIEAEKQRLLDLQEELNKRERDLNKGFMEIAARERELQGAPADEFEEEDDDVPALQPEAERILDKFVGKRVEPVLRAQQELYQESVNETIVSVASKTGVSEEAIVETIQNLGLAPQDSSLKAAREVITAAAEIAKAKSFDADAMEKSIREKILKDLAESGVKIEGVKPSRAIPVQDVVDTENMSMKERYEYIKSKQNQ